ncbi:MAG TPA: flagellar biosynthesis anti-sigma factor FlgM [Gammaproteobacteria bacterium]|nr:flagellar biosynthesis anti-sigma factor FlgM [Gammaproteobacteria bacterium]
MAINSIFGSNNTKPSNIADSQKTNQVNRTSREQGITNNNTLPSAAADTVSLTGTASQLRALEQQLASLPVVDVQRVDSVKREISNGSYEINPPRIADKMIQMEMAINQGLI